MSSERPEQDTDEMPTVSEHHKHTRNFPMIATDDRPAGEVEIISGVYRVGVLKCNGHRYVVQYTNATRSEALRSIVRLASDHGVDFSWYNAAVMSQAIRRELKRTNLQ